MKVLIPDRQFDEHTPEMMDFADAHNEVLRDDLRNLRTINKYFGGLKPVRKCVREFILENDHSRPLEILDLATGSADHPISIVRLARSMARPVRITAIERNPHTALIARERTAEYQEISIQEGDILQLGLPPRSFDLVLCSLALHHFSRKDAVRILATMSAVSRRGVIVNDLRRSWPGAWTAWLYTHVTTRNLMTLNDSYASVLRAFTRGELLEMTHEAGVPNPRVFKGPFFRLLLVGRHELIVSKEPVVI